MNRERLDLILDPDYLGDLPARSIEDVRAMRTDCQLLETGLSYLRRVVQARLDIVGTEVTRRAEGAPPTAVADMVARLPDILADRVRSPGVGRLPQVLAPADVSELLTEVDDLVSTDGLASLSDLSEDDLGALIARLGDYERDVSEQRRALHDRIDALQAELTRRYKTGEASVESLLR